MTSTHLGRAALFVALAILGAACAPSNHIRFQGVWAIDIDRMIELDPDMREMLASKPETRAMIDGMMGKARITIGESDLEMTFDETVERATYTVVRDEDDTLVFLSIDEGKTKEDADELTARFRTDDSVEMTKKGDTDIMALRRVPPRQIAPGQFDPGAQHTC